MPVRAETETQAVLLLNALGCSTVSDRAAKISQIGVDNIQEVCIFGMEGDSRISRVQCEKGSLLT